MPAAIYDLAIEQGAKFTLDMVWTDSEGAPLDLTGYIARMQLRSDYDKALVLDLTSEDAITLGGAAGTISVIVGAIETAALTQLIGVYDLELQKADDPEDVVRLLEGKFRVSEEVTK